MFHKRILVYSMDCMLVKSGEAAGFCHSGQFRATHVHGIWMCFCLCAGLLFCHLPSLWRESSVSVQYISAVLAIHFHCICYSEKIGITPITYVCEIVLLDNGLQCDSLVA